ncbi:MAG TPA: dihydrodipicolinate synthase family protein, partial [Candidatus Cybelea sp.]|nr:dihydrodipicolinate synthase family protein [Candidatus Cybelea sp.]
AERLPVDRMMVGTGTTSLDDSAALTRAAFDCEFAGALVMPPFFYRDVSDDGVIAYFDALFSRTDPPDRSVILYNFPAASGVTFTATLVDRMMDEFPKILSGIKDSSNDRELQQAIAQRHPDFAILPSSEEFLAGARDRGTAGCISGSVALWPQLAKRVFDSGEASQAERLSALRRAVAGPNMILRVRYLTSSMRNDDTWERAMPPLGTLTGAQKRELDEAISRCA